MEVGSEPQVWRVGDPPAAGTASEPTPEPASEQAGARRSRRPRSLSLLGALAGLALMVASATPSLVPRDWPIEAVLAGVCFLVGYAAGWALSWGWRSLQLPGLPAGLRRAGWWAVVAVAPVALLVAGWLGRGWQADQRELLGMPTDVAWWWVLAPALGAVVVVLVLGLVRLVAGLARVVSRLLSTLLPARLAIALAVALTAYVTWQVATGVLVDRVLPVADDLFASVADADKDGVDNPESAYRSAGPGSVLEWDELSREGRYFVSSGLSAAEIAEVTGAEDAVEPVRVYVSVATSEDPVERAEIAVEELRRSGGFDRGVIAVAGTTGTGWIDPKPPAALEYLTHGDVAIVATQYSYLPSWLSYLVDRSRAEESTAELLTAIRTELDAMPVADRPELYVFGESLGAFSVGSAFTSVEDMATTTDGALMIGPPNFEPTWVRVQERREPGSPIWQPRYRDGALARTLAVAEDLSDPSLTWQTNRRIIYLVHPSDPIVAWQVDRSDWLDPRGSDVPARMNALPVVSWLQGTFDQLGANAPPPGHGHVYDAIVVPAWAEILGLPDLSAEELETITQAVAEKIDPDRRDG